MKVLQINAVYAKSSTGRTTQEMHEYFQSHGIRSYIACPDLAGLSENCYKIGNFVDYKLHALFSRVNGKQGWFSKLSTKGLLKYMDDINPDVVILRNVHGNYVNLPILLQYLAHKNIATILVLHDSWFYTGNCTYYIAPKCNRWKDSCGKCPVLHSDVNSYFCDKTKEILKEKEYLFGKIKKLAVIGVSNWVTADANISILKNSFKNKCIYNWIDLKTFKPKDKRLLKEKYGFHKNTFIVLGISAVWSVAKGIDLFHSLAEILPKEMKIVLVGNSDAVKNKNENISYLAPTNKLEDLSEIYAMADVFVNPTIQETFGKTTAEALSSGVPIVAYNGTATPELVGKDEKCGYLIDSIDAKLFADRICQIYNSDNVDYTHNCRSRAETMFNLETNIQAYINLMNEMIINQYI